MKITLLGSFSVWKTTVTNFLQETCWFSIFPDVARLYAEKNNIKFDEITNPYQILNNQIEMVKLHNLIKKDYEDNYVEDWSIILAYIYSKIFCSSISNKEEYKKGIEYINSQINLSKDEIILFLPISFAIKQDWLRHTNWDFQKEIENEILAYLNHNNIKYYFINEKDKEKRKNIIKTMIHGNK